MKSAPKMAGIMAIMASSMGKELCSSAILTRLVVVSSWLGELCDVLGGGEDFCEDGERFGEERGLGLLLFWFLLFVPARWSAFAEPVAFEPMASESIAAGDRGWVMM
jgi:hypothetical protein